MAADDFVLILRSMYVREQPQIAQTLETPSVSNKALQISMIKWQQKERNNRDSANELETQPEINGLTVENDEDFRQKVLQELESLPKTKLQRTEIILSQIFNSKTVDIGNNKNLVVNGFDTKLPVANFLYNMQQPNMKLDNIVYPTILSELNLGTHLLINRYAKRITEENRYASSTQTKLSDNRKAKDFDSSDEEEGRFETPPKFIGKNWANLRQRTPKIKKPLFKKRYSGVRKREKLAEGKWSSKG